jgi:hypothetical protein
MAHNWQQKVETSKPLKTANNHNKLQTKLFNKRILRLDVTPHITIPILSIVNSSLPNKNRPKVWIQR